MASIQKRPDGKWRARYRDAEGKEHSKHFPRKIDAQQWLDGITTQVRTGTYVDPAAGSLTLLEWYRQWSSVQVWKQGTHEQAEGAVTRTPFAGTQLRKITSTDVQAWIKGMTKGTPAKPQGLSPNTITTRYKFVSMCFAAAVKQKLIGENPAADATLPRRRRKAASMTIPTPEQVGALLDNADPYFRSFIAVCAFAGLRLGECAALQPSDVDFLRRTLTVSRQVQGDTRAAIRIEDPKDGSERVVFIAEGLTTLLAEHMRQFGVWRDAEGQEWLFSNGSHLYQRKAAAETFRRVRERAGVGEFTLHDLRHFYASGLIAQGCDVVTVQRSLGHSSPSVTLDTYSHLWPSAEDRTRAAAGAVMESVPNALADYTRTNAG